MAMRISRYKTLLAATIRLGIRVQCGSHAGAKQARSLMVRSAPGSASGLPGARLQPSGTLLLSESERIQDLGIAIMVRKNPHIGSSFESWLEEGRIARR